LNFWDADLMGKTYARFWEGVLAKVSGLEERG